MRNTKYIVLFGAFLFTSRVIAQQPGAPMDTARVKLGFLTGNFATETRIPAMPSAPKGATGKGTSVITWGLDSMFLLIDEQSVNSVFGQYKGHGVLGFDGPSRQYILCMYNNFGDHPVYKGDFLGDTLVLKTTVAMPGHAFDQQLLWYKEGHSIRLKVLNDTGQGLSLVVDQIAVPVNRARE